MRKTSSTSNSSNDYPSVRSGSYDHGITPRWIKRPSVMQFIYEVAFVGIGYLIYSFGRDIVYDNRVLPALDNAREIMDLERALGIFRELQIQSWLLETAPDIVYLLNWFYILGYLPVVVAVAVFLYTRDREAYRKYRTVAFATFGIALVIYELYPLAPPRMLSSQGFVDTIQLLGPVDYHTTSDALLYNPFAAMPSLHFGLAFVISLHFLRGTSVTWRLLALGYLGLMLFAIVVTGNHYILDALASVGVVGAALIACSLLRHLPSGHLLRSFRLPAIRSSRSLD